MRNWTWALVLTIGALAVLTSDANAQRWRRGVVYSPGYNTYYYPGYMSGYAYPSYYSYPSYAYSSYGYSPGVVYSSGYGYTPSYAYSSGYTYAPAYGYSGYSSYASPYWGTSYYGTSRYGMYTTPWGTGVTAGGRTWGAPYAGGWGYGGRYWR
jgi:hypothetical protein